MVRARLSATGAGEERRVVGAEVVGAVRRGRTPRSRRSRCRRATRARTARRGRRRRRPGRSWPAAAPASVSKRPSSWPRLARTADRAVVEDADDPLGDVLGVGGSGGRRRVWLDGGHDVLLRSVGAWSSDARSAPGSAASSGRPISGAALWGVRLQVRGRARGPRPRRRCGCETPILVKMFARWRLDSLVADDQTWSRPRGWSSRPATAGQHLDLPVGEPARAFPSRAEPREVGCRAEAPVDRHRGRRSAASARSCSPADAVGVGKCLVDRGRRVAVPLVAVDLGRLLEQRDRLRRATRRPCSSAAGAWSAPAPQPGGPEPRGRVLELGRRACAAWRGSPAASARSTAASSIRARPRRVVRRRARPAARRGRQPGSPLVAHAAGPRRAAGRGRGCAPVAYAAAAPSGVAAESAYLAERRSSPRRRASRAPRRGRRCAPRAPPRRRPSRPRRRAAGARGSRVTWAYMNVRRQRLCPPGERLGPGAHPGEVAELVAEVDRPCSRGRRTRAGRPARPARAASPRRGRRSRRASRRGARLPSPASRGRSCRGWAHRARSRGRRSRAPRPPQRRRRP